MPVPVPVPVRRCVQAFYMDDDSVRQPDDVRKQVRQCAGYGAPVMERRHQPPSLLHPFAVVATGGTLLVPYFCHLDASAAPPP